MWAGYRVGRVLDGLTGLPDMVVSVRFVKSPHGIHLTADPLFSSRYASTGPENEAGVARQHLVKRSFVWIGWDQVGVVLAGHGPVSMVSLPLGELSYDGRSSVLG